MPAPDYPSLPSALDAPRKVFESDSAGYISYYDSETGTGRPLVLLHSINAAPSAMEIKPLSKRLSASRMMAWE